MADENVVEFPTEPPDDGGEPPAPETPDNYGAILDVYDHVKAMAEILLLMHQSDNEAFKSCAQMLGPLVGDIEATMRTELIDVHDK